MKHLTKKKKLKIGFKENTKIPKYEKITKNL